jgi:RNA polymerase sigma-70 factor (ECF subfamily)
MERGRRQQIQEWIVRFADGERAAFEPLFAALWPLLLALARRGLPSEGDAEDAAQQAMLKIFGRIADFDRSRDGLAWALAVAGCEVMTVRRQRHRRREVGDAALAGVADRGESAEEGVIVDELRRAVRDLVGELPERDREALAAALAGEPPAGDERARKRRFRAIERLRAAWRRAHG